MKVSVKVLGIRVSFALVLGGLEMPGSAEERTAIIVMLTRRSF